MEQVLDSRELARALSDLARRYQFRSRDEVCCYGVTASQCYALEQLARRGVQTASELARQLGLDLSSTTRVVDQLVRRKLVQRRLSSADARVRELEITPAGGRVVEQIERDLAATLDAGLAGLAPSVRRELPAAIRRIVQALECCEVPSASAPLSTVTVGPPAR